MPTLSVGFHSSCLPFILFSSRQVSRRCFSLKSFDEENSSLCAFGDDIEPVVQIMQVDCLVGLVVKLSASSAADPGFDSRFRRGDFSRLSHTGDVKIGTPVATLPGAWHYRVSAWTDWPSVSIVYCDWVRWKV